MRGMADQAAAKKATPKSRRWPRGKICIAASAAVHVERAGHRNRPLMRLPPRLAASSFSPRPQASGPNFQEYTHVTLGFERHANSTLRRGAMGLLYTKVALRVLRVWPVGRIGRGVDQVRFFAWS